MCSFLQRILCLELRKSRLQTTKAVLVTAFDSQYNEAVEANGAQTTPELRTYKSGE